MNIKNHLPSVTEGTRQIVAYGPLHIVQDTHHPYDSPLNTFFNRYAVDGGEVILVTRIISGEKYTHAEPSEPRGRYAMGGRWLVDGNGNHEDFQRPVPLHDLQMWLEAKGGQL